jgi:hypothetical protein
VNAAPDIDLRTDIYSLGVMLHQMITGKAAYDTTTSSDFEVQTLIVKEPLPRAKTIYPYASDHLQELIDKATQKKRENRFQDCDQFKLALFKKNQKPLPPTPTSKNQNSGTWIGAIFLLIIFVGALIFFNLNKKSNSDSYPEELVIDTTTTFIETDTDPTVIIDSSSTVQTENSISDKKKEEINKKILSFNGGYIVDKIEEYNYDINNSQWKLSKNTDQGELFLNNYNLSFKKSSLGHWLYLKLEFDSFDRKNNWFVLNDNYEQKILMDTNFKSVIFVCDFKNNHYLTTYVYHISRKSELVNPNNP